jgi:hypothetical protein
MLLIVPHRVRAPARNGEVLSLPPLTGTEALLAANRQRLAAASGTILGKPLADLRAEAKDAVVKEARTYLASGHEPLPSLADGPLILAGHQPELFHPGVWIKNFALARIAQAHLLTAVNLVVDNDTVKSTSIRLPAAGASDEQRWALAHLPFDVAGAEVPYEERTVKDEALFADFAERAADLTRNWPFPTMLQAYWREVLGRRQHTSLLGERFAAARRVIERHWQCHNLEVPVSAVCRTEPFAWFACHVLDELPRFHAIYNTAVHDYRKSYGIRSRNHPVPDLATDGDWLEVPLWVWRADRPQRERLFARKQSGRIEMRAGRDALPELPALQGRVRAAIAAWQALENAGIKVRSRALTNTLFARLFVGELFIHGIGGGKYDELTDAIIRRFYGFEPPGYIVLSGTLHLPFPSAEVGVPDLRKAANELRDLRWNPQRHLDASANGRIAELAARKQGVIEQEPANAQARRERFFELRRLTDELSPAVAYRREEQANTVTRYGRTVEDRQILDRRDYAFCLYPEAQLREFVAGAVP